MKRAMTSLAALCLAVCLALPAGALDYTIAAPDDPEYGDPTSVEPVVTADGGAAKNEDRSKNAALIPPATCTRCPVTAVPTRSTVNGLRSI